MTEDASDRLGRPARIGLAGFGLVVLLAALPVGFFCLLFAGYSVGGGHGVTPRPIDWAVASSLLALALLMLALGVAGLICVDRKRLRIAAGIAALLTADGALALAFLNLSHQRPERPPAGVTVYPDVETARRAYGLPEQPAANAVGTAGGETLSIACSPVTGKSVSSRSGDGQGGARKP